MPDPIVMLLIAALILNAVRLSHKYNLWNLTTLLGRRDWYFQDNSPYIDESKGAPGYNGMTVWSVLFLPVAAKGFYHSTMLLD